MTMTMFIRSALFALAMATLALPAAESWAGDPEVEAPGKGQKKGKDKSAEAKGKAGEEHGKAGEAHGKAGEAHGKAGEEHGKAGEAPGTAAGEAGGVGAGQDPEKAKERIEQIKAKAKERMERRAERAKEARERARGRAKEALRGKDQAMTEAFKQELRRYARRIARISRVQEVAAEAGDAAAVERTENLLVKEKERHKRWMDNFAKHGGAAGAEGGQDNAQTGEMKTGAGQ